VTATPRPLLNKVFQNSGLKVDFDCMVTASDIKNNKPAPDPYARACDLLGLPPEEVLVIEDSPPGL